MDKPTQHLNISLITEGQCNYSSSLQVEVPRERLQIIMKKVQAFALSVIEDEKYVLNKKSF